MTEYQTPKGMRDYSGELMERRLRMMRTIESVYRRWGYQALSTPAMESVQTLNAKAGAGLVSSAEIAGQLFRIEESELALRFDLTVPLARFASNQSLPKPYKRYCIAPVWRREEPQKGRLREFLQADADVIGCASMRAEAELLAMASEALGAIGITQFEILLNNRKILGGVVEKLGLGKSETEVFRALDKLEKLGPEGVRAELEAAGVESMTASKLLALVSDKADDNNAQLEKAAAYSPEGAEELRQIIRMLKEEYGLGGVRVDLSLVRGLGYYTGPIFEIKAGEGVGSVSGGGRYDRLLEIYGQADTAVGISFGIERLLALEEERKESKGPASPTQVLVVEVKLEQEQRAQVMQIARKLRAGGISVETDLNERDMNKQLKYANANSIPFALIVGKKELEAGQCALKDLRTGQQDSLGLDEAARKIKQATGIKEAASG